MSIKRIETIIDEYGVDNEDYVEYAVVHEDDSIGSAYLRITYLDDSHYVSRMVRNENIPFGSKAAHLFFYPNSETSGERQGVGLQVLDFVLNDARTRGIMVVYCMVTNNIAGEFFRKNGFKGGCSPDGYLVIS